MSDTSVRRAANTGNSSCTVPTLPPSPGGRPLTAAQSNWGDARLIASYTLTHIDLHHTTHTDHFRAVI